MNLMRRRLGLHPGNRFALNRFGQRVVALVEFIAGVKEFRQDDKLRPAPGRVGHKVGGAAQSFRRRRPGSLHLNDSDF